MTLSELIERINNLSDEQEPNNVVIGFVNGAISRINIECDSKFPKVTTDDLEADYPLPDKWVESLFVPFGVGRIKQRDSSQFEYTDAYEEFMNNLDSFQTKYDIPDEYLDDPEGISGHESDLYTNPPWYYGGF